MSARARVSTRVFKILRKIQNFKWPVCVCARCTHLFALAALIVALFLSKLDSLLYNHHQTRAATIYISLATSSGGGGEREGQTIMQHLGFGFGRREFPIVSSVRRARDWPAIYMAIHFHARARDK